MAGKSYKVTLGSGPLRDVLDDAFGEVSTLASELRDWADNMANGNLGATNKYNDLDEAASTLESNEDTPDLPTHEGDQTDLGALDVSYAVSLPRNKRRGPSRQVQLDNACCKLSACIVALDEYFHEHRTDNRAETLRDEIQEKMDELEGVTIPGMYG